MYHENACLTVSYNYIFGNPTYRFFKHKLQKVKLYRILLSVGYGSEFGKTF